MRILILAFIIFPMKTYLNETFDFNDSNLISTLDELSLWSAPFGMKLLDTIKIRKNINILDIGFGTGFPLLELAQRFGNTCQISGIDPWLEAIDLTKRKIEQYGIKNVRIIKGVAEKIPCDDNLFDLIVSNNGLNNVTDQKKAYSECFRLCKSDGQMVFTFNLPDTMIEFYHVFENVLHDFKLFEEIDKMKTHVKSKRKTIEETQEMLANTGFKTEKIITDSFMWRYADGTTMLNHYFIKLAFLGAWKKIIKLPDLPLVFNEIEKRLNKIALEKGEFDLTIPYAVFDCRK
jgi:ubiquinone/menaquinone biosynthesis C-methylase UbiE